MAAFKTRYLESNKLATLSVIVPSVDRPHYLDRAFDYWGNSEFDIIVATNSKKSHPGIKILISQETFINRVIAALDVAEGDYCVLCPDDDFMGFNALKKCIQILDDDKCCASVVGKLGYFRFSSDNEGGIEFLSRCHSLPEHCEATVTGRVESGFQNYSNNYWVVFRKSVLKKVLVACDGLNNHNVAEFIFKFGALMEGTIRSINRLLWLRELMPISWGRTEADGLRYMESPTHFEELKALESRLHHNFTRCMADPIAMMVKNYESCVSGGARRASFRRRPLRFMVNELKTNPFFANLLARLKARYYYSPNGTLTEQRFSMGMTIEEKEDLSRITSTIRNHGPLYGKS